MTHIAALLAQGRTYSFEFFPPKTDEGRRHLARALVELRLGHLPGRTLVT